MISLGGIAEQVLPMFGPDHQRPFHRLHDERCRLSALEQLRHGIAVLPDMQKKLFVPFAEMQEPGFVVIARCETVLRAAAPACGQHTILGRPI